MDFPRQQFLVIPSATRYLCVIIFILQRSLAMLEMTVLPVFIKTVG